MVEAPGARGGLACAARADSAVEGLLVDIETAADRYFQYILWEWSPTWTEMMELNMVEEVLWVWRECDRRRRMVREHFWMTAMFGRVRF